MKYDLAIYIALTAAFTSLFKDLIADRLLPFVSLIVGSTLGLLMSYDIIQSMMIGLTASGAYRGYKVVVKGE